eukprot:3937028-Rhodomonas_salina.3
MQLGSERSLERTLIRCIANLNANKGPDIERLEARISAGKDFLPGTSLRSQCYDAMPGSEADRGAISLRMRGATIWPGTNMRNQSTWQTEPRDTRTQRSNGSQTPPGTTSLRACYAMTGTDLAYGATSIVLRACCAMSARSVLVACGVIVLRKAVRVQY